VILTRNVSTFDAKCNINPKSNMRCNLLQTFFTFEWKRFPETRTRSVFGFLINTATLTVQRCMTFNESLCRQAKKSSNLTNNSLKVLDRNFDLDKNDEK